jgi:TPR repeat protein
MKTIPEILHQLQTEESIEATFMLGYLYLKDEIIPKDLKKSFDYFQQAALMKVSEHNSIAMKYKLAAIYNVWILACAGHGKMECEQEASTWYENATEFVDADILYCLGLIYEHGLTLPDGQKVQPSYQDASNFYASAAKFEHADAEFRLARLFFKSLIPMPSSFNTVELFEKAKQHGNQDAKFYLHQDWSAIWPSEDWLTRKECSSIGQIFGMESGMPKLLLGMHLYEDMIRSGVDFTLDNNGLIFDERILFWLQMLVQHGTAQGAYEIGKFAFVEFKKKANSLGGYFKLSSMMLMLPRYVNNSQHVEVCVKLYIFAKVWLTRAKEAGMATAEDELQALSAYKDKIESKCSGVFNKFKDNPANIVQIWAQVQELVRLEQLHTSKRQQESSIIPSSSVYAKLDRFILESNLREYRLWVLCIQGSEEVQVLHRRFFDQAARSGRNELAVEFLRTENFDVNYLIEGLNISPLQFVILQNNDLDTEEFLLRSDVDVNFNLPLSTAASVSTNSVKLLLRHSEIEPMARVNIDGKSIIETSLPNAKPETINIIREFADQRDKMLAQNSNESDTVGQLYFKYKGSDPQIYEETDDNSAEVQEQFPQPRF